MGQVRLGPYLWAGPTQATHLTQRPICPTQTQLVNLGFGHSCPYRFEPHFGLTYKMKSFVRFGTSAKLFGITKREDIKIIYLYRCRKLKYINEISNWLTHNGSYILSWVLLLIYQRVWINKSSVSICKNGCVRNARDEDGYNKIRTDVSTQFCKVKDLTGFAQQIRPSRTALKARRIIVCIIYLQFGLGKKWIELLILYLQHVVH